MEHGDYVLALTVVGFIECGDEMIAFHIFDDIMYDEFRYRSSLAFRILLVRQIVCGDE